MYSSRIPDELVAEKKPKKQSRKDRKNSTLGGDLKAAGRPEKMWKNIMNWFFPPAWEDGIFMDDVRQATLRGVHPIANRLFWAITLFFVFFIVWAMLAKLDEVTRGQGKVIPSGDTQTVQNLEGGIVKEILTSSGAIVNKGDILVRIDDTGFASTLGERRARIYTLMAAVARLDAELEDEKPKWPAEVVSKAPQIIGSENTLYLSRKEEIQSAVEILTRQLEQKQQELREVKTKSGQASRSYTILNEELQMTIPLEEKGVVSKVDILRLKRQVNDLRGEMDAAKHAVPRAEAAIKEARQRVEEAVARKRTEALTELTEKKDELGRLQEAVKAVEDQVDRTTVRSPVHGTIKRVLVNTVGQVIQPGMDIVEVVPIEENLVVEARIRPQDVAFLRPNQKSRVKITAYDPSVYGSLEARLIQIAADTVQDEKTGEPFYEIQVRTDKGYLGTEEKPLPIMPGMVATVEILTGKKTVWNYMMKPFNKMRQNALSER
jgi:adhesin transport system membrane fusion protein